MDQTRFQQQSLIFVATPKRHLSSQNLNGKMLWRPHQQFHIHTLWTSANNEYRNTHTTHHFPKQLHSFNVHHPNLQSDQGSNDKQSREETPTSWRYIRSQRDSSISWQRKMMCNKKSMQQPSQKRSWSHSSINDTKYNRPRAQQSTWYHHERRSESNFSTRCFSSSEKNRTWTIIQNVITPRQSKRPCVVLYNANNEFPKIREIKTKQRVKKRWSINSDHLVGLIIGQRK